MHEERIYNAELGIKTSIIMTQDEFIIEYVLRLAQNKTVEDIENGGMIEADIDYAVDMVDSLKKRGVEFEPESHYELYHCIANALDHSQTSGGFAVQFRSNDD